MKPTLRLRLAALLLAPTAALMALPAAAQHSIVLTQHGVVVQPGHTIPAPAIAPAALIERFVLRPAGRIEPGRELRFVLMGAPGGDAWLDIPGVARGLDLREVRPGVYEASYTVRRRDNPDAFARSVATLQRGGQRVTAQVELRGGFQRDERAPEITDLTPAHGERVGEWRRTQISARLSDDRSGVDAGSVRLRIDGQDVTHRARIDQDEVRYRDALGQGRHTAELVVRDRAGNVARRVWSFDVIEHDRRGGWDGDRWDGRRG